MGCLFFLRFKACEDGTGSRVPEGASGMKESALSATGQVRSGGAREGPEGRSRIKGKSYGNSTSGGTDLRL